MTVKEILERLKELSNPDNYLQDTFAERKVNAQITVNSFHYFFMGMLQSKEELGQLPPSIHEALMASIKYANNNYEKNKI